MMRIPNLASRTTSVLGVLAVTSLLLTDPVNAQISAVVTESGQISLSLDGAGSNNPSHTIDFDKPVGATVRGVYLGAASWNAIGDLSDNSVVIDGVSVVWDMTVNNPWSFGVFESGWVDLTATSLTTTLNLAPPGPGTLTINEVVNNTLIDGEILAIIWDDPNVPITQDQGIILLFGAQSLAGDTFNVNLAQPLDLASPDVKADLSLGISFSYQEFGGIQISEVDVNGSRMTSSSGGEDDGASLNGALITVGGIGDSNANPAPFDPPLSPADPDDELYDLLPFYVPASTLIVVDTFNPSDDDNIFFAAICTSVPAITQGILLSPPAAINILGDDHTVTALVLDSTGAPVVGTNVDFLVASGPNMGDAGSDTTDAAGEATFTYTGDGGLGDDTIVATFVDSMSQLQTSNTVDKTWQEQCMMLLGSGTAFNAYSPAGHMFITQVGEIQSMEPVLLDDLLTVRVPVEALLTPSKRRGSYAQWPFVGPLLKSSLRRDDVIKRFSAQVLMWNPKDFPTNPEKYSRGLMISVSRYGNVEVVHYGHGDNMELWIETDYVANPAPGTSSTPYVDITFPFVIND